MTQAALDFETPALPVARTLGEAAAQLAVDRAEREAPGFSERAQAFVLAYLAEHGTSSGEDITDACKVAGIKPPDDRAFGSVYQVLARRGAIVAAGFCARRKGHGTAGGRLWARPGAAG